MATSFAAYASQFLTRQQNGTSSPSSSQPMFFSFTTDQSGAGHNSPGDDLDDLHDPHLRASEEQTRASYLGGVGDDDDDDDPYLRLDEDDRPAHTSRSDPQSVPLISSELDASESPKGWLAHQASPLRRPRSPSPSPTTSSDSGPPADLFSPAPTRPQPPPPPPMSTRVPVSLSLTESLLPRDGHTRPIDVFSLPDPRHIPRGRRKYNDSIWTALWCTGVSLCLLSSILILFLTRKPTKPSRVILPYTTLLHTVPMLTILTFLSGFVAYAHIFLLQIFVRPVMIATSVFIPATLFISAVWAFVGSFMWEVGQEPTWGETVGLRLFALIPLALSAFTARRLVNLPRDIHTTSATLTLTTNLLLANPFLLTLSPVILLTALVASIPFLTLIFRLLLIGYITHPVGAAEWHVKGWANWAIVAVAAIWLWSWGVARGVLRVTCAGVIGAWYFADPEEFPPPPTSTHTIHAALMRSTSPSLGTIVLSALLLTGVRILGLLATLLRVLPVYLPPWMRPVAVGAVMLVGVLENVTTALSKYALVYTGLTGDAFFVSARRARALTAAVEAAASGRYRRKFKAEPPLTLLTVAPLTLTFPFALATYLFVAHTLGAPDQALGASVLAGGVTALVGLFCVGLVKDTADTLYLCYCIDKELGERKREEVFLAFEYQNRSSPQSPPLGNRQGNQRPHQPPLQPPPSRQREHPIDQRPTLKQRQPQPPPQQKSPQQGQPQQQRRQAPLSKAPLPVNEDIDPFEQSYLEDDSRFGAQDQRSPLVLSSPDPAANSSSRAPLRSPPILSTSREMDGKRGVLEHNTLGNSKKQSAVLESQLNSDAGSDNDGGGEESEFFPGSGFF